MSLQIVRMTRKNAAAAAALAAQNLSSPWSESTYLKQTENPNDYTFIAYENGEPVGFLSLWFVLGEIQVNNVAVSVKFRRRHIATQLFEYAGEHMPPADSWVLEVRESNDGAARLYSRLGFEPVGVRKGFYSNPTENAVIMIRREVPPQKRREI